MLQKLVLENVGPSKLLALDPLAPGMNLITGDNGLGKSFILETAWWALTRTWNGSIAVPSGPNAKIGASFDSATGVSRLNAPWDPQAQIWKRAQGKPPNPGIVIYARVDGSFSVWDPARNYRLYRRADAGEAESPAAYQFTADDVLFGLERDSMLGGRVQKETLCRGLIDEWALWQQLGSPEFDLLTALLARLGPEGDPLAPGALVRPTLDDVKLIPTVRMPYGQDVPITYAPAGVQRMTKLAYLLAWVISEHVKEVERLQVGGSSIQRASQVMVFIDEPETHLHPRWQRTVLPGLIRAVRAGWLGWTPDVQFLVATHSPLVLASLEPLFDPCHDALWKLDLVNGAVHIERDTAYARGDATMWLLSDVFDGTSPYSREAEQAMAEVSTAMGDPATTLAQVQQLRAGLIKVVPDTDPFWLSLRAWMRSRGWSP